MNNDDVKHEGTKNTKDHEEYPRYRADVMRLTGKGVGAIGVVLVEGEGAREVIGKMVRSEKVEGMRVEGVLRGEVLDGEGRVVDDVVVVRVGELEFEVHCHGGVAVVEGVMRRAEELGAERTEVVGGGIAGDVEEALGKVLTMTGARLVAEQLEEGLMGWARGWSGWLKGKSENDLWRMQSAVQWVLGRSGVLRGLVEGVRVAIVGLPNAGKSTLANALIGRTVSITSEVAGTTRDWVEAEVVFVCGEVRVQVTLVDTAGVRETGDALEREAIVRAGAQAAGADVVVVVRDVSREEGSGVWCLESVKQMVLVGNKVDLGRSGLEEGMIEVSAKEGRGLEALMEAVVRKVGLAEIGEGEVFAFCERQVGILEELALVGSVEGGAGIVEAIDAGVRDAGRMSGMDEPEVALIVVTHDSEKWLAGFFESWRTAVAAYPVRCEVVVADSGSRVSPEGMCAELCSEARVILCGNVGYGAAVNRGVAETRAPWVIFCNPDITFASDFSEKFCNLFHNENETTKGRLGVMSPIILNPDGSRQWSIGSFPTIGSIIADQFRERSKRKYNAFHPVPLWPISWATGACLMVRRDTFNAVHGFDEKFFLYVEEVDFQKRLRNARFINFFCPPFTVTHHAPHAAREESAAVRKYSARGLLRYFAKHGTWGQLFWFRVLGVCSGRLSLGEGFASRGRILERGTGEGLR